MQFYLHHIFGFAAYLEQKRNVCFSRMKGAYLLEYSQCSGVGQVTDMLKVRGEVPSALAAPNFRIHGMATAGNNIYILMNFASAGQKDRLFIYKHDFCTFVSIGVNATIISNSPPESLAFFGFVGERESLYLFGGVGGTDDQLSAMFISLSLFLPGLQSFN